MKKGFCNVVLGVILMWSIVSDALAQSNSNSVERMKKEKVQIVAAQKKGPEKSGSSGRVQKPRFGMSLSKD